MPDRVELPSDYDDDPGRFRANLAATQRCSRSGDVHPVVAERLTREGARLVLDLGGGTGTLGRVLSPRGVRTMVVDHAAHLAQAPPPRVRADLSALPCPDDVADAVACLWVLYHLPEPAVALREAARVLRPGGRFVAATSARTNDPELAGLLPGWGRPGTFDAEDAGGIVAEVFDDVEVVAWDAPMVHLPDRAAAELFLRGRGLPARDVVTAAATLELPLDVTKRGALIWARCPVR